MGHSIFLLVRGPAKPQSTVRDDEERRCRQARRRGHATRVRRRAPPRHRPWPGPVTGAI